MQYSSSFLERTVQSLRSKKGWPGDEHGLLGDEEKSTQHRRTSLEGSGKVSVGSTAPTLAPAPAGWGRQWRWRLGLLGACEGEQRRLVMGPSMAWGAGGLGARVPANSSVVIDVKVDKVERDLVFNFLNQISSGTFNNGK